MLERSPHRLLPCAAALPCRSAGLDQDQFIRLLREPGQQWRAWDIWGTAANGGDGLFPSQAELDGLDGIVITGDRCAPGRLAAEGGAAGMLHGQLACCMAQLGPCGRHTVPCAGAPRTGNAALPL